MDIATWGLTVRCSCRRRKMGTVKHGAFVALNDENTAAFVLKVYGRVRSFGFCHCGDIVLSNGNICHSTVGIHADAVAVAVHQGVRSSSALLHATSLRSGPVQNRLHLTHAAWSYKSVSRCFGSYVCRSSRRICAEVLARPAPGAQLR